MTFRNYTPFPHLLFESRDVEGHDFGVLVLRGTFEIVPGAPLRPLPDQEPVVMVEKYAGEPGISSLLMENNLAPYKPKSDIHIIANAHAPGSKPATEWQASVSFGVLKKQLNVTGPRFWTKNGPLWQLSDALPVSQVPVNYESAYGGNWEHNGEHGYFEENPAGVGFVNKSILDPSTSVPAPSVYSLDASPPELNVTTKVEGLGPIAPSWQPRLKFAGTYDDHWKRTRWPELPNDFKFEFFNSAHPDLIYPSFLEGNEQVMLTNLSPHGKLNFSLPDYLLAMLLRFEDGELVPAPMRLDTVHLDVPSMRAYLVWRGIYALSRPMRVLEARLRENASEVKPQASTKEI